MALDTCRDCGNQVSDTAPSCPKCGRVFNRSKPPQVGCCSGLILGALALFMFGVCQSANQTPEQRQASDERAREAQMEYNAREAVKASLRDPESARFGDVIVVLKGNSRTVCGTVNAKNAFGGYVGDAHFVGLGDGSLVMIRSDGNAREFLKLWGERCKTP